jgi:hypothetical protein
VPTHVQLQRDFAPPKGGERPAALTRNGSGLGASDLDNCAALPVHWLVAVPDAQDLLLRAKHLLVAAIVGPSGGGHIAVRPGRAI